MMQESLEGQAMELGWIRDNRCDLDDRDYLRMVLKKTCWYSFIQPCRIGALIATRDGLNLDRFNRFGYFLGAAFQIQDDLLNLTGDEDRYGKEIGGDLLEGKRTLMLLHLFRNVPDAAAQRLNGVLCRAAPPALAGRRCGGCWASCDRAGVSSTDASCQDSWPAPRCTSSRTPSATGRHPTRRRS